MSEDGFLDRVFIAFYALFLGGGSVYIANLHFGDIGARYLLAGFAIVALVAILASHFQDLKRTTGRAIAPVHLVLLLGALVCISVIILVWMVIGGI